MPIRVFLSHSSLDKELIRGLIDLICAAMPIDPAEIRATSIEGLRLPIGVATDRVLREEIRAVPVFIAVVSDASSGSAYVLFELGARWGLDRPLLPLVVRSDQFDLMKGPLHGINALRCDNTSDLHQFLSDISPVLGHTLRDTKFYEANIQSVAAIASAAQHPPKDTKSRPRGFLLFAGYVSVLVFAVSATWLALTSTFNRQVNDLNLSLDHSRATIVAQYDIIHSLTTPSPTTTAARPTPTLMPTPTQNPSVRVPAGGYMMGSNTVGSGFPQFPEHYVATGAFFLGDHEVTNQEYLACVTADKCTPPGTTASNTRSSYFGNSQFSDYPVVRVSYIQALDYCTWVGGQLPTEEQWERAARADVSGTYPWGNATPSSSSAVLAPANIDTMSIRSHPSDQTPSGIFDLAGNVSEWTSSWYVSYPGNTPPFDFTGSLRVVRGGSFATDATTNFPKTFHRSGRSPYLQDPSIGFRCAWPPP